MSDPGAGGAASAGCGDPPLRILHIINDLTLGGAETLLYRIATTGSANEHIVVSLGKPQWYSAHFEANGVELHHLGINSAGALPKGLAGLRRIIRESDPDVVHTWMYRSNVVGGAVAKIARKPVVWGIHCSSIEELRPASRALARLSGVLARWIPDFIVNCSIHSAELHGRIGYSAAAGAVIHNGYDPSVFFPDEDARAAARANLGLAPDDFVIGSISRWDSLKDIPNLLSAFRIVRDRGIAFRAVLIGAGLDADNPELQRALQSCGCAHLVQPLGRRNDVEQLARALDLHVLASRTEAFPSVIAETMLSETPSVATDVGDAAAMVRGTGWLVPPHDPERLADAIAEAYREWEDKPTQWQERRRAARRHIADKFSFDGMVRAYEDVWRRMARGRAPVVRVSGERLAPEARATFVRRSRAKSGH